MLPHVISLYYRWALYHFRITYNTLLLMVVIEGNKKQCGPTLPDRQRDYRHNTYKAPRASTVVSFNRDACLIMG